MNRFISKTKNKFRSWGIKVKWPVYTAIHLSINEKIDTSFHFKKHHKRLPDFKVGKFLSVNITVTIIIVIIILMFMDRKLSRNSTKQTESEWWVPRGRSHDSSDTCVPLVALLFIRIFCACGIFTF